MAWRCSGKSNTELVSKLRSSGVIKSRVVEEAMLRVDRKHYVRDTTEAYQDSPQPIGYGVTVSAPHMHGMCLEYMKDYLKPGMKGLDCGSGSGYLSACMKHLVGEDGLVVGIEYIKELVPWSISNCTKDGWGSSISSSTLRLVHGDASHGYHPTPSPLLFNAIHVGAAAPQIPQPLLDQLASPGILLLPLGTTSQSLTAVRKSETGRVTIEHLEGVMYVPFHMKGVKGYTA
eukprot:TRINITY_DN47147_c0_g1_i1.p1 TRINITY_DN47147_c0_g1~~TRINITY_DN47147_c0_g1_i1.p1  ORF type:complete len:246 (+),score=28.07 TRINITY_DN47147_c0_g1_i1:46-738(+)